MKRALLFDIDGTLIHTGGAGARALDRAFKYLFGIDGAMKDINPHGKTDPEIVREIFKRKLHRQPDPLEMKMALFFYVYFLKHEVDYSLKFRTLPGVKQLLEVLTEKKGILLGLATGNVKQGARVKLSRPGLWGFFAFGGFGSDAENRVKILLKAVERASRIAGNSVKPIVIGDTPRDVIAAHRAGIPVLAVATSRYSVEDLKNSGADYILPDLKDTQRVLEILENY